LNGLLTPGPTRIMGIVNVTSDSFSDGGRWLDPDQAIAHGIDLMSEGADLIDIGAESTRPGAARVPADEELARLLPVVAGLSAAGVPVSVDTTRSTVAAAAIQAGALIVNDVSGGLADPRMLATVASSPAGYVVMHWREFMSDGAPRTSPYSAVVSEVITEVSRRAEAALRAGIEPERLILDPGIGFSKTTEDNWALLRAADRFQRIGLPVLWGVSRKGFLAEAYPRATEPSDRDAATVAVTTLLAALGVWGVRTHEVASQRAAVVVAGRMRRP
jgi:dihydropteroate synthase